MLNYGGWSNLQCLETGSADEYGNVHVMGTLDEGWEWLKEDADEGIKIWLVLSDDVDCGIGMTAWNPSECLFEYNKI